MANTDSGGDAPPPAPDNIDESFVKKLKKTTKGRAYQECYDDLYKPNDRDDVAKIFTIVTGKEPAKRKSKKQMVEAILKAWNVTQVSGDTVSIPPKSRYQLLSCRSDRSRRGAGPLLSETCCCLPG